MQPDQWMVDQGELRMIVREDGNGGIIVEKVCSSRSSRLKK